MILRRFNSSFTCSFPVLLPVVKYFSKCGPLRRLLVAVAVKQMLSRRLFRVTGDSRYLFTTGIWFKIIQQRVQQGRATEARCDDAATATAAALLLTAAHVFRSKESHDFIITLFQDTTTFPPSSHPSRLLLQLIHGRTLVQVLGQAKWRKRGTQPAFARSLYAAPPIISFDFQVRVLILGLDNAGKTTILYRLHSGEVLRPRPAAALPPHTISRCSSPFSLLVYCRLSRPFPPSVSTLRR